MTKLLETARTVLCVDDNDRWGFWCKLCPEPIEVIGDFRQKEHAAKAARRHEGRVHS